MGIKQDSMGTEPSAICRYSRLIMFEHRQKQGAYSGGLDHPSLAAAFLDRTGQCRLMTTQRTPSTVADGSCVV